MNNKFKLTIPGLTYYGNLKHYLSDKNIKHSKQRLEPEWFVSFELMFENTNDCKKVRSYLNKNIKKNWRGDWA